MSRSFSPVGDAMRRAPICQLAPDVLATCVWLHSVFDPLQHLSRISTLPGAAPLSSDLHGFLKIAFNAPVVQVGETGRFGSRRDVGARTRLVEGFEARVEGSGRQAASPADGQVACPPAPTPSAHGQVPRGSHVMLVIVAYVGARAFVCARAME